jgi:hypothetical protein
MAAYTVILHGVSGDEDTLAPKSFRFRAGYLPMVRKFLERLRARVDRCLRLAGGSHDGLRATLSGSG